MEKHRPERTPSRSSRVLVILVLVTCLRVWLGPWVVDQPATAQIPDSGLQRKLQLDEARKTNQLLAEIKQLLTSHTFNVHLEGADNQAGASAAPHGQGG